MEEKPVLPVKYLLLADAAFIALAVVLIDYVTGFEGIAILPLITIPVFILISSFGLWMWANGAGASMVSSPGWNTLNDDQKTYGVSVFGLHLAIGMALVSSAIPFILIPGWGLIVFLVLLLSGMAECFAGAVRVMMMGRNSTKKFVRKSPLMVWGTVFLILFAAVAIPMLALEESGPNSGVQVKLGETEMTIDAPLMERTVKYADIEKVELDPDFKIGERISGYGGLSINSGKFRNSEYGQYSLASYSSCDTFVKITLKSGGHVVFNQKNVSETEALYSDLLSRL